MGFVIVGGQDNVLGVARQMLGFFAELGFHFPQFPFVAHSRGWCAEDMENNPRRFTTRRTCTAAPWRDVRSNSRTACWQPIRSNEANAAGARRTPIDNRPDRR
jgi:hypothetical protein